MTARFSIVAFSIGTSSSRRPRDDDEATDVLRQMPGKADQNFREIQRLAQTPVRGIEPGFTHAFFRDTVELFQPHTDPGQCAPLTSSESPRTLCPLRVPRAVCGSAPRLR